MKSRPNPFAAMAMATGGVVNVSSSSLRPDMPPRFSEIVCDSRQTPYTANDVLLYYQQQASSTVDSPSRDKEALDLLALKLSFLQWCLEFAQTPTLKTFSGIEEFKTLLDEEFLASIKPVAPPQPPAPPKFAAKQQHAIQQPITVASLLDLEIPIGSSPKPRLLEPEVTRYAPDTFAEPFVTVYQELEKHHAKWLETGIYPLRHKRRHVQFLAGWFIGIVLVSYIGLLQLELVGARLVIGAMLWAVFFLSLSQVLQNRYIFAMPRDAYAIKQMRKSQTWAVWFSVIGVLVCILPLLVV